MSSNTHPPKEALELHATTKDDPPNRNTACTKDVAGTLRYGGGGPGDTSHEPHVIGRHGEGLLQTVSIHHGEHALSSIVSGHDRHDGTALGRTVLREG
jgi:hypothetical protein